MSDVWDDVDHRVFLCNFGGPTSEAEVQPFLEKLFLDPLIIRAPLGRFRPLLAKRISKKRSPTTTDQYKTIGFSPINKFTEIQAQLLEQELKKKRKNSRVIVVNRYTPPFADQVMASENLRQGRNFMISLYPHFCHSTTASSFRDVDYAIRGKFGEPMPSVVRVNSWWYHSRYLEMTTRQVHDAVKLALASAPERVTVLYSAHGIPTRYHMRGDPYSHEINAHCQEMTARLKSVLDSDTGARTEFHTSFQSRVGPVEWLKPYTEDVLKDLGQKHKGALVLVPISFTSDHIETLYEMDVEYKKIALESGFKDYYRAKPANDDPELAICLAEVLENYSF